MPIGACMSMLGIATDSKPQIALLKPELSSFQEHIGMLAVEKRQLYNSLEKERAKTEQLKAAIRSALNKQPPLPPSHAGDESISSRSAGYEHAPVDEAAFPPPPPPGSARYIPSAGTTTSSAVSTPKLVVGGVIVPGEVAVPPPLRLSSIPRRRSVTNAESEGRPHTDRTQYREQWSGGGRDVRSSHDGAYGGRGTWKENDAGHNNSNNNGSSHQPPPMSKRKPEHKPFQTFKNPQEWNGSTVVNAKTPPIPRGFLPPPPKPATSPRRARVPKPPSAPREAWGGSSEAVSRAMRSNRAPSPLGNATGGDPSWQVENDVRPPRMPSSGDGRQIKPHAPAEVASKPTSSFDAERRFRQQERTDLPSLATSWIGAGESAVVDKRLVGEGQWLGGFMEESSRDKLKRLRGEMTQIASLVRSGDTKLPVDELRK